MASNPGPDSPAVNPASSPANVPQSGLRIAGWLLATAAAMVVVLRFEGRRWWCACGDWALWSGDVSGSHNSQHLLDPYAFTHMLHGVGFWLILRAIWPRMRNSSRLVVSGVLEGLWEILENSPAVIDRYRTATAAQGYLGDSIGNALGDLVACLAGTWLAARIGVVRSLVLFVVTEVVLAFWIRDGLLLNILMLLWPIEAIKVWQTPVTGP